MTQALPESAADGPNFQERLERNYDAGVRQEHVAGFWRELCELLPRYGLRPTNEITSVGSVYFDNRDFDLTRYTVLNPARRMLIRLRAYENYGEPPAKISDYWVEIKTTGKSRWRKKRFRLPRTDLADFLDGKDISKRVLEDNHNTVDREIIKKLYTEIQELIITMGLKPCFLLTYKRLAFQNDLERISLDWDMQYYHVGAEVFAYDSWKYPVNDPAGKSQKTILELKYPRGTYPPWISELERKHNIRESGFLKFVEGMGCLMRGPLKGHRVADYFLRLIEAYGGESRPLG